MGSESAKWCPNEPALDSCRYPGNAEAILHEIPEVASPGNKAILDVHDHVLPGVATEGPPNSSCSLSLKSVRPTQSRRTTINQRVRHRPCCRRRLVLRAGRSSRPELRDSPGTQPPLITLAYSVTSFRCLTNSRSLRAPWDVRVPLPISWNPSDGSECCSDRKVALAEPTRLWIFPAAYASVLSIETRG